MPAIEYACSGSSGPPTCALIMCPGSSGGMGPGIGKMHRGLGLEKRGSAAAFGSIYTRLAVELSTGEETDSWDPPLASRSSSSSSSTPADPHHGRGAVTAKLSDRTSAVRGRPRVACLHMTWRRAVNGVKWPAGKLKQVSALADAVDDVVAAADYLRDKYGPHLRVILAGFSFGGPSVWAAARRLGVDRVCGVASIAGSARGGERFRAAHLDTEGGVRAMDGVPRLWVHGTRDLNVAPAIARHYWEAAEEPKCALWVVGSEHMFDVARGAVYRPLKEWVTQVATTQAMAGTGSGGAPYATDRADRRMTWLTTGAHVSVMPMRAALAERGILIGSARFKMGGAREGQDGRGAAAAGGLRRATREREAAGGGAEGKPFGDTGRAWSRIRSPPSKGQGQGQGQGRGQGRGRGRGVVPLVGVGAGWVDVSASLGEGHVEAAAEVNALVKPMTLEKLLKNPNAKGYSE